MQPLRQAISNVQISFSNGCTANTIQVQNLQTLPIALEAVGLTKSRPVLVLIGGAGNLNPNRYDRLQHLFIYLLAPLAEKLGITVVDGGTDTGIMRLMGLARAKIAAKFPLVGVAPTGKIYLPNTLPGPDRHPLEPHHTHFILVPGNLLGDESPWLAQVAGILASEAPSVSILVNGGKVSLMDVQASIAGGRPVLVITETGRLADEISAAILQTEQVNEAISSVVKTGCFTLCKLSEAETHLALLLNQYLLGNRMQELT
jgi:hypothetical protein